jgi:hypothetical protein
MPVEVVHVEVPEVEGLRGPYPEKVAFFPCVPGGSIVAKRQKMPAPAFIQAGNVEYHPH